MNWSIPTLFMATYPSRPRWLWWGVALLIMLVGGFFLAISLLPDDELQDRTHLLLVAVAGPFLLWTLAIGGRLMAYDVVVTRIDARNETVLVRQQQWHNWACQSLELLAWGRQTGLGESELAQIVGDKPPVNSGNCLSLPTLNGISEWQGRAQLINSLLQPVSQYWQTHSLSASLTLLWQVSAESQNAADWQTLITRAAETLSLPLNSIESFPHTDFSEWLSAAWTSPFAGVQCLIFIDTADNPGSSEEAVSLLLAPADLCKQWKLTSKASLLRPLLAPAATLSQALKLQCEQQISAEKLTTGWYCRLTEVQAEKVPLACIEQETGFTSGQLYATDSVLGLPGLSRHAVMITLAAECRGDHLLFTRHQEQFLLQQLSCKSEGTT
ncbi:MAG: hypothetical protein P4L95_18580 [Rouxiella aceris]|uniref:hypothetical protein n=1 Tax=Rouxiella aceris TaxID=2703884 RepID=UPI00284905F4|nr:hypothetical protein [Rouxiella aceris]MDR3433881.1 hypothetical protein [Rouxiella aceris]